MAAPNLLETFQGTDTNLSTVGVPREPGTSPAEIAGVTPGMLRVWAQISSHPVEMVIDQEYSNDYQKAVIALELAKDQLNGNEEGNPLEEGGVLSPLASFFDKLDEKQAAYFKDQLKSLLPAWIGQIESKIALMAVAQRGAAPTADAHA